MGEEWKSRSNGNKERRRIIMEEEW